MFALNVNFLLLDIVNFYPSITEKLFNEAITFARSITHIEDETIEIIKNARKSLLFFNGKTWKKTIVQYIEGNKGSNGKKITNKMSQTSSCLQKIFEVFNMKN